ncbi:hypothetical protein EVAR_77614_1 [Eumeta japonica]|uniref:Uncharacterized protein n=1 Tax=Eumeta variegata TaxID=151549 RepID=A0A4C1T9R0_EUMVA|nr:hypothetical protein EVAR_77614_1 [Eumeta japonica]
MLDSVESAEVGPVYFDSLVGTAGNFNVLKHFVTNGTSREACLERQGSLDCRWGHDLESCRGPSDPALGPLSPFWWARPGWRSSNNTLWLTKRPGFGKSRGERHLYLIIVCDSFHGSMYCARATVALAFTFKMALLCNFAPTPWTLHCMLLDRYVVPACLPVGAYDDSRASAIGFGLLRYMGSSADRLQKVNLGRMRQSFRTLFAAVVPAMGKLMAYVRHVSVRQSRAVVNSSAAEKWAGLSGEIPHSHIIRARSSSFRCCISYNACQQNAVNAGCNPPLILESASTP